MFNKNVKAGIESHAQRRRRFVLSISLLLIAVSLLIVIYGGLGALLTGQTNFYWILLIGLAGSATCSLGYGLARIGKAEVSIRLLLFVFVASNTLIALTISPTLITMLFFLVIAMVSLILTQAWLAYLVLVWNGLLGFFLATTGRLALEQNIAIPANSQISLVVIILIIQLIVLGLAVYLINNLNRVNELLGRQVQQTGYALNNIEQKRVVGQTVSEEISNLVVRLQSTLSQQASGSYQQASSLGQLTSFVQEITQSASIIASKTTQLNLMAQEVRNFMGRVKATATTVIEIGETGASAVERTIEINQLVCDQYTSLRNDLVDLKQRRSQLGEVVSTIEGISAEINLLSLNAAIEAAGAGVYGDRFNVVATEVKELANRSIRASHSIKEILGLVETRIQQAVSRAETGYLETQKALLIAQESGQAISELVVNIVQNAEEVSEVEETVGVLSEQVQQIKFSTSQQSNASEQAVEILREISQIASQIASGSQETALSTQNLEELSRNLLVALTV